MLLSSTITMFACIDVAAYLTTSELTFLMERICGVWLTETRAVPDSWQVTKGVEATAMGWLLMAAAISIIGAVSVPSTATHHET